jgi:hypothetical protein
MMTFIQPMNSKSSLTRRLMRNRPFSAWLIATFLLALPGLALSQAAQQNLTLTVNGRPGVVPVVQVNGRSYVEIEALARIAGGSLSFEGRQIVVTLPGSNAGSAVSPPSESTNRRLSGGFLRAEIEEMAVIREWRSVLGHAVRHAYPITEEGLSGYRSQAATGLSLATAAASTDSDRDAAKLLANELDNMQKLSNKILDLHTSMNYIAPDALADDPLNQKVLTCAQALASMAADRQFQDDGSCH